MLRYRRAGTLSAGITLIVFGILFILRMFVESISYSFIFSLWPLILILLGAEVILSFIFNNENSIRYDGWGVFLMISILFFACGMAVAQLIIDHLPLIMQSSRFIS